MSINPKGRQVDNILFAREPVTFSIWLSISRVVSLGCYGDGIVPRTFDLIDTYEASQAAYVSSPWRRAHMIPICDMLYGSSGPTYQHIGTG